MILSIHLDCLYLIASGLASGWRDPGSSPGQGHCVVFLGKTLCSQKASLHIVITE